MSKQLSFIFALTAVVLLAGAGISLSFRMPWLALLLLVLVVFQTGAGFVVKARLRRRKEQQ